LCGISGLKPTYGRVSRYGMIAYASSLDQGGPMARTAEDIALLMNTMAGFDTNDSTSIDYPVPDYTSTLNDSMKGLRIGLPKEFFGAGLDKGVEEAIQTAIKEYEKLGATIHEISLPHSSLSNALLTWRVMMVCVLAIVAKSLKIWKIYTSVHAVKALALKSCVAS
jgi:aspartyl-tRNA(Asn)/glutamyl-tRNA(Gln) amidotransferase subunit A